MKVAAVIHQFPPDFTTGTEILCLRKSQALIARGHDVRVMAADPRTPVGSAPRAETIQGVDVRRIGTARPPRLLLASRIAEEFANPEAQAHLEAALRAFAPDVIHLYQSQQFGLAAAPMLAKIAPVLATVTDFHLVCPLVTASLDDGTACGGPGADGAVCIAHLKARETVRLQHEHGLKRAGLVARERLRALPFGDTPARLSRAMADRLKASDAALAAIDLTLIGPPRLIAMLEGKTGLRIEAFGHEAPPLTVPARPVGDVLSAGFFSSISRHKGVHVLLDAIAAIPQDVKMRFTICGPPGPDDVYVRQMQARAAADPRVAMSLGVPHDEMGAVMGAADIVVIPSLWDENNPLVLLDALEAGRYVVASNSPGMTATMEPPKGGITVPAGDANALARALIDLATDPDPVRAVRKAPIRSSRFAAYIDAIEARYNAVRARRTAA